MKIGLNPHIPSQQATSTPSSIKSPTNMSRIDDTFVTMGGKSNGIKGTLLGFWTKVQGFGTTVWSWVWWIIRLCPAENTRIEAIEEIVESPDSTDAYKGNPAEFVGEVVAAALLDPRTVQEKRRNNPGEFGTFIRKFKDTVEHPDTLIFGANRMLAKVLDFLGFHSLDADNPIFAYFMKHPALIAGAIQSYCSHSLDILGDREGKDLENIRIMLGYLQRMAKAHADQPSSFSAFIEAVLARSSFDLEQIRKLATSNFDGSLQPTSKETAAFRELGANGHQAIFRLINQANLLNRDLPSRGQSSSQLGWGALYQAAFRQLGPNQFAALAQIFKGDYPLAQEVCLQLQDIAGNPRQLARVHSNLPEAFKVLGGLLEDYQNPPSASRVDE